MSELGLCQGRVKVLRADGTDICHREAAHEHYAHASGQTLKVCTQHRDALLRRERLGSSQSMLDHWNGG